MKFKELNEKKMLNIIGGKTVTINAFPKFWKKVAKFIKGH